MSHHSSSVNGEGTSHKDPLSRILDELSSLKLWKEKQERKEKGKKRVEENEWKICVANKKLRRQEKNMGVKISLFTDRIKGDKWIIAILMGGEVSEKKI